MGITVPALAPSWCAPSERQPHNVKTTTYMQHASAKRGHHNAGPTGLTHRRQGATASRNNHHCTGNPSLHT
eukprot:11257832-Heterocapsa_arctica.AAC.1